MHIYKYISIYICIYEYIIYLYVLYTSVYIYVTFRKETVHPKIIMDRDHSKRVFSCFEGNLMEIYPHR